jgi:choline/ethanolamine kinase
MRLIDYEYSGFNPIAFDIANHWCEWAADYHTASPHLLDFSQLPTRPQQAAFVRHYLAALLAAVGVAICPGGGGSMAAAPAEAGAADAGSCPPAAAAAADTAAAAASACPPALGAWLGRHMPGSAGGAMPAEGFDALCAELHAASLAFMCVSHAQWALWGLIQAQVGGRVGKGLGAGWVGAVGPPSGAGGCMGRGLGAGWAGGWGRVGKGQGMRAVVCRGGGVVQAGH